MERFIETVSSEGRLTCGWTEANGDGLADFMSEFIWSEGGSLQRMVFRGTGLAEDQSALLPENSIPAEQRFHEVKRGIFLPGPVNVIDKPRNVCRGRVREYTTRKWSALVDLTGDAISDYVYFGTQGRLATGDAIEHPRVVPADGEDDEPSWWIMVGTGTDFRAPIRIESQSSIPFELHLTQERCDGRYSNVVAGLVDINGDGRVELVRRSSPGHISYASIAGETGGKHAHDSGSLTHFCNGYGGATQITYGSAKADHRTDHQIPRPEIVVTQVRSVPERGLSDPLVPTQYAYGKARLHYQPLLGLSRLRETRNSGGRSIA